MIRILSLLPVESILRFKSVSKAWNSFLSSPSFATTHSLSSSPVSTTFPLLVLQNLICYSPPSQPLSLSKRTFSLFASYSAPKHLNFIQKPNLDSFDLFVGNPATGKFVALPGPSKYFILLTAGFDFDPISRNFKMAFGYSSMDTAFQLGEWFLFCSIARNWRPIQEIPIHSLELLCDYYHRYGKKMVCIGNTFYTIYHDVTWDQILTSDNADKSNFFQIQLWNGRVSVVQILEGLVLKIWVLSEENNWVQVMQLDLESNMKTLSSSLDIMHHHMRPVLLMGDTLFIRWMLNEENIIAYNVKSRTHQVILEGYCRHSVSDFQPYRPTLFACDPFTP
ncbi:hypothetical protein AMTRI_Chr07g24530 [Amborella trichopoda]